MIWFCNIVSFWNCWKYNVYFIWTGKTIAVYITQLKTLHYLIKIMSHVWQIFFIDYGNSEILPVDDLLDYSPQLKRDGFNTRPGLAIECVLSEVQPSLVRSSGGKWLKDAVKYFEGKVLHKNFYASIYSVVNSVVALELYSSAEANKTVNLELIQMGFAQFSEESYLSKVIFYFLRVIRES